MARKAQSRPPNTSDPLSEHTTERRLWAAYLRAGHSRYAWAKLMGVAYTTAARWDAGTQQIELDNLVRAVALLGHCYTLQELVYGHRPPRLADSEPHLGTDGIAALLYELQADNETIEAFGEYARSAAGQFQYYTRSFVAAFATAYAGEYARSKDRRTAIAAAKAAAVNARALAETTLEESEPITATALEVLGREARATPTRKPSRPHATRKKAR